MKVKDIVRAVEEFAPLGVQEPWDNSGLLVGSPEDEVRGVMVAFDCTPSLVDEAIREGCDMIVTHHPLIFDPLRSVNTLCPVGEAVVKAVRGGVAVYAAHTTADKVPGGVSWAMAERLGLENVSVLDGPQAGPGPQIGLGVVGDLPGGMTGEEFAAFVKERFSLEMLRCSFPVEKVCRVAMCGGSGASLIPAAMESGAQAYICADISYHHFFTPKGFMVLDIGHFESEKDIVPILFEVIRKKFPNFAIRTPFSLENPVKYR